MRPYQYFPDAPKPVIVPLYRLRNGVTTHVGTGILLTSGNRQFLCTPTHVVGHEEQHDLIVCCHETFRLGEFVCSSLRPGAPVGADLDVAFSELSRDQARCLTERSRFISLDIDTPWEPSGGDRCLLRAFGCLCDDNVLLPNNMLTSNCVYIDMVSCKRALMHDEHRKRFKLAFISGYYNPVDFGSLKEEFRGCRDYSGMSGGALFYGDPFCPGLYSEFAGMLIEAKVDKRARVRFLAVRTRAIIELLHGWFTGLPPLRPPTTSKLRRSYVQ